MRKLTLRERRILQGGGLTAAVVLVYFFAVEPFNEARASIPAELETKARLLQRSKQLLSQRDYYRSRSEELERRVQQYENRFIEAENSSDATTQVELAVRDLASRLGITISRSSRVQERVLDDRYARITLRVNLQADLRQVLEFVHAVSTYPKFLKVENLELRVGRVKGKRRLNPSMHVSGLIQLSPAPGISTRSGT